MPRIWRHYFAREGAVWRVPSPRLELNLQLLEDVVLQNRRDQKRPLAAIKQIGEFRFYVEIGFAYEIKRVIACKLNETSDVK